MKTVIFDLDGTLICSHEDVWNCLALALQPFHLSIPPDIRADNRLLAKSAGEILKLVYPAATSADCERYAGSVHHLYADQSTFEYTTLYPEIYELMEHLNRDGYRLFVVTMKPEESARSVLKAKGIAGFFAGVYSPDSFPPNLLKKSGIFRRLREQYGLRVENCTTVGDSPTDVAAAHAASLPAVAVTWGYGEYQAIENCQPDRIVSSAAELSSYFFN